MPRRNGSYFGFTVAPTPTSAGGIWRVSEAEEYLRVNKWPATPGVPGSPSGTAGNGQVSLTWSAPTLGSPPTAYLIQYSSDSGSTWTTFDPGGGALSATVTGLTNDTGYIFRIVALNVLGQGPYGSASGTIIPSASTLPLDLLGFWKLADNTDASGNGLTLTETNVTYAAGKLGNAASFSGSGSLALNPWSPSFGSEMTVAFWFKIVGGGYEYFLVSGGYADSSFYVVKTGSDVKTAVSGTGELYAGFGSADDGGWHFCAVRRTGSSLRIWVDETYGEASGAYDPISTPGRLRIGANWDGSYLRLYGMLDAVGLWNRALTDSEIAQLYNSGDGLEFL